MERKAGVGCRGAAGPWDPGDQLGLAEEMRGQNRSTSVSLGGDDGRQAVVALRRLQGPRASTVG